MLSRLRAAGALSVIFAKTSLSATALAAVGPFDHRQVLYQNTAGGDTDTSDRFGDALAAVDLDCDGYTDLAVGVPMEDVEPLLDAGQVWVFWGSPAGLVNGLETLVFSESDVAVGGSITEADDGFGQVLAAADFDGDGCGDLAIGTPRENLGTIADAGSVTVLYGDPLARSSGVGALTAQRWDQNSPGVIDVAEFTDNFGAALGVGDFNGDQIADLAIGVPGEELNDGYAEGLVHALRGSPSGLEAVDDATWNQGLNQDLSEMEDTGEVTDMFGFALTAADLDGNGVDDLVIGVPGEDGGTGAIHVVFGTTSLEPAEQNVFCDNNDNGQSAIGSRLAASDSTTGTGFPIVLGVPLFDANGETDSGMVGYSATNCDLLFTFQAGTLGTPEPGDMFGESVLLADLDGDGADDLVIGTPGQAVSIPSGRQGVIHVLSTGGPDGTYHQGSFGSDELSEQDDEFGSVLVAGDFDGDGRDDVAIGVPLEDRGASMAGIDAGGVQVLYTFNPIFTDGFESGDLSAWSAATP
jgi:hypothetical protein